MNDPVQIVAAAVLLVAYGLAQLGLLARKSLTYLLMNTLGSETLAIGAWAGRQWGILLLEGVWALISGGGIACWINKRVALTVHNGRLTITRVSADPVAHQENPDG